MFKEISMIIDSQQPTVGNTTFTTPDWVHGTFPLEPTQIIETSLVDGDVNGVTINVQTIVDG